MLQVKRECGIHVKEKEKSENPVECSITHIRKYSGKETQKPGTGLDFDINGKILGNLVSMGL